MCCPARTLATQQKDHSAFCVQLFSPRMCVRVCVITYAWLREGVKLDSKILYNTAYICHGRELPHELNRDKEQIYLKWLCYIPWTTVKLKKISPKNELRTYIYEVIYMYMHYAEEKPRWTPYFLPTIFWIYSRNNQISCFPFFLTSCPVYLFVPCSRSGWLSGHLGPWTPNNQRDKLQEDSPIELMIIKLKEMAYYKLDIVFLLLF